MNARLALSTILPLAFTALLAAGGCEGESGGSTPDNPNVETLDPGALTVPAELADGDLACLGKNAPPEPTGQFLELTGYVRLLSDPEADQPPPAATVEAFSPEGVQLGKGFANPAKKGRVSVGVGITKAGFTGYAKINEAGYLGYRFQTSRAVTNTDLAGWAWLATQAEADSRAKALDLTLDAGKGILVGAIHDCTGFGVEFAVVTVNGSVEGVYYVEGFGVVKDRNWTSATGRFVVPNLPPGKVTVKAFGRLVPDGPFLLLSSIEATVEAGEMTAVDLQPRVGVK